MSVLLRHCYHSFLALTVQCVTQYSVSFTVTITSPQLTMRYQCSPCDNNRLSYTASVSCSAGSQACGLHVGHDPSHPGGRRGGDLPQREGPDCQAGAAVQQEPVPAGP